jgi:hypothetical protein
MSGAHTRAMVDDGKSNRSPVAASSGVTIVKRSSLAWLSAWIATPSVEFDQRASRAARRAFDAAVVAVDMADACLIEADAVLSGSLVASDRLWLLLRSRTRQPVSAATALIAGSILGEVRIEEPRIIDGQRLVALVAGTVRAANTPSEAEAMLDALSRVMDPLFVLEWLGHAIVAAEDGRTSLIEAFGSWYVALSHGGAGEPPDPQFEPDRIWQRRPDYDEAAWVGIVGSVMDRWKFPWPCVDAAHRSMSRVDLFGPRYAIDSITSPFACPGDTLIVRGTGFGLSGTVRFPVPDHDDPESASALPGGVAARRWTDTEIEVKVPTWARAGDLSLMSVTRVTDICFTIDVCRLGNTVSFHGGLPRILAWRLTGASERGWIEPGADVNVSWSTTRASINVEVRDAQAPPGAPALWRFGPAQGTGSVPWRAPVVTAPTRLVASITATNMCGSVSKTLPFALTIPARLEIVGVEVTQGIQTFPIRGDTSRRNSVPVVANKDTILRVFVSADRSRWFNDRLTHFSAAVSVDGRLFRPINRAAPGAERGLLLNDAYLDLGPTWAIDRADTDSSFNFRIPKEHCRGTKTLVVNVFGQDEFGTRRAMYKQSCTWVDVPAIPIRYVRVGATVDGIDVTPNEQHARETVERALDMLPFPATDIAPAWIDKMWTTRTISPASELGELLDDLVDRHIVASRREGADKFWIGVIPNGAGGKARVGHGTVVASWYRQHRVAAAHELGHVLCLLHIDVGCPGRGWPAKSTQCGSVLKSYQDDPPSGGQVMDPPFDPFENHVVGWSLSDPDLMVFDLMTYGCRTWTSAATWKNLINMALA